MARKRSISSDISTDPKLAMLAGHGALPVLIYTWGIPHADDWGRLPGDPIQFKLMVCPAFPASYQEIEQAINQVAEVGLWQVYDVDGKQYIAYPRDAWFKHQSYINTKKRDDDSGSSYPAPPDWEDGEEEQELPESNRQNNERQGTPIITNDQQASPQNPVSPSPSPSPSLSKDLKEGATVSEGPVEEDDGPAESSFPFSENEFNELDQKQQVNLIVKTYRDQFPLQIKEWGTAGVIKARNIFETAIAKGVYPHDLLVELWYWHRAYKDKPNPPPWKLVEELVDNCENNQVARTWAYCVYTQDLQNAGGGLESLEFG